MARVARNQPLTNSQRERAFDPPDALSALESLATTLRSGLYQIERFRSSTQVATRLRVPATRERMTQRRLLFNATSEADCAEIEELITQLEELREVFYAFTEVYERAESLRAGLRCGRPEYASFAGAALEDLEAATGLTSGVRGRAIRSAGANVSMALNHFQRVRAQREKQRAVDGADSVSQVIPISTWRPKTHQ